MGFYLNEDGERHRIEAEELDHAQRCELALYYFVLMALSGVFVAKLLSGPH